MEHREDRPERRVVLQREEQRRERRVVERRGVAHEDDAAEERVDVRRGVSVKRASERGGGISSESVVSVSGQLMTGKYARWMTSGDALTSPLSCTDEDRAIFEKSGDRET